jgi:hypothetical protein
MEIRALTGFNEQTRRKYGRSYSPLNGTRSCTALGSPIGQFDFSFQDYIKQTNNPELPEQQIETVDPQTGQKRWFTVDNINNVLDLITKGFKIVSSIRKPDGTTAPVIPDYTGSGGSGNGGSGDGGKKAGLNITTVLGGAIAAYIVFSLLMSKK